MNSFYKNKKVLVTGGCSFIGSHLTERLVSEGACVTVVDDLSSGLVENISRVRECVKFIHGDLRLTEVARQAVVGQEMLFHLANIHGGRGFIETHPGEIAQNLLIDGNIFLAAHLERVDRICYTSSACAYPVNLQTSDQRLKVRYLEEEMADPFTVGASFADGEYGWAKLMGEMALKAYCKQFGQKGVSCRLFTVFGPRENESHAIIAFIAKALLKQDPYEIWGSGQQDRNFTFIDDVVAGLMLSMEKIDDCSSINIGTDEITKIVDAARSVCSIVGHSPSRFHFDTSKPEGVHARAASVKKQQQILGWRPSVSFIDGLVATIDWYRSTRKIEDIKNAVNHRLFSR